MVDGSYHMQSIHPAERYGGRHEPCARSVHLLLLSLLMVPACATGHGDVRADDDSVGFTGGRLNWVPDRFAEQESDDPSDEGRSATISFDLDISLGSGQAPQHLEAGQVVVFGGRTLTGPEDLLVSYDLTRVLLDARLSLPISRGLFVESFGGLEYSSMDVDVRTGSKHRGVTSSEEASAFGPAIGAALVWQPIDAFYFSVEGRLGAGWWPDAGTVKMSSLDVGLCIFSGGLGTFFGWRTLSYESDSSSRLASSLDFELSGPVIAVWIHGGSP